MSTQQPAPGLEEGIDLRRWIDATVRYKWLILTFIIVVVAAVAIASYVFLPTTFESSGTAVLPSADGQGGIGMPMPYARFRRPRKNV